MRIAQINVTCDQGGTGKIALAISELLTQNEIKNVILYSSKKSDYPNGIKYTTRFSVKMHALISRVLGNYGFDNKIATRTLISHLKRIKPEIIHIHNVHSHDCDLTMLFNYIRKNQIKVYWTFHDCWAFTGYCPYFDMVGCDQWKTECRNCTQRKHYSWFFDRSNANFRKKRALFDGVDVTIVTPSHWLCNLVKQSFLKDYPVKVIHNGIDLAVFKPRQSDFREKYNCKDKFILLGVSFMWENRKGLDVFLKLADRLDERYQIVLVGIRRDMKEKIPDKIIKIGKTSNQKELAEIYTAVDLFVNPTREENYPTVNMEALACGTPVLTFDTGGSGEMVDETCGCIVPKNDIETLYNKIIQISEERPYSQDSCLQKAKEFDASERLKEYIALIKGVQQY